MISFFDLLKNVYTKEITDSEELAKSVNTNLLIGVVKWLSYDVTNLPILKKITNYMFYMEPLHFYYLLLLSVPHRYRPPFLRKHAVESPVKQKRLYEKIKYVLDWSERELRLYNKLLDKVIKSKEKYWKGELGLK